MTAEQLITENRSKLWKLFIALGVVVIAPFAAWLFCVAIGGGKTLIDSLLSIL